MRSRVSICLGGWKSVHLLVWLTGSGDRNAALHLGSDDHQAEIHDSRAHLHGPWARSCLFPGAVGTSGGVGTSECCLRQPYRILQTPRQKRAGGEGSHRASNVRVEGHRMKLQPRLVVCTMVEAARLTDSRKPLVNSLIRIGFKLRWCRLTTTTNGMVSRWEVSWR